MRLATNISTMVQKFTTSIAGRMLIGYFVFKVLVSMRTEASPVDSSDDDQCSTAGLKQFLGSTGNLSKEDVELMYEHCRGQFLDANKLSASVKQTVDDWIGTDLSKAETNQIFLIYELALTTPKPEKVSKQFERDCDKMVEQFQNYRDSIEPLTNHMDINLDSLLTDGSEEIDDQERELFNFVQYSQFCKSFLLSSRQHK